MYLQKKRDLSMAHSLSHSFSKIAVYVIITIITIVTGTNPNRILRCFYLYTPVYNATYKTEGFTRHPGHPFAVDKSEASTSNRAGPEEMDLGDRPCTVWLSGVELSGGGFDPPA